MPDPPVPLTALADPSDLLHTLLDISLTAVNLLSPVYKAGSDEIIDFTIDYINPAGQRMVGPLEQPYGTIKERFPASLPNGVFAFYQQVFASGKPDQYKLNYQADGLDNYFQLAAQRSGELLVVSFTDTADQDRSAVELALRESQIKEREGLARIETQRQQLDTLFSQAPACIARLSGPTYVFTVANPLYHQLFGGRQLVGKTIREALPELESEPFFGLLDEVYRTGETFYGNEIPIHFSQADYEGPNPRYFNFINQATHDATGTIDGILVFAYEVSELVQTRRQMEQDEATLQVLNQQLAATNLELVAATQQAEVARAETELEREQLRNIFMQAPAMICIFEGPDHRFRLVNPYYQQLVGERPLVGRGIREAMPELAGQPIFGLLDKVYRTGETFYAQEMLVQLDHANTGTNELGENFYNFIYQATRDLAGQINGILVFAYEVTAQVKARQQVERSRQQVQILNEKLATANEELQAANEEFLVNNAELFRAQHQLEQLNKELEGRVQRRTNELQRAQAETERQRLHLERLFMQAPAAICILSGPDLVFELVNPSYQQLFPNRRLLGRSIYEALSEIANNRVAETFRCIYELGGTHEEQALLIPFARPDDGVLEDRYFNFIQQARYNERGEVDGVLVFAFEVTEQVEARKASEASTQQLRLVTDALPVLIGYLDREEKYQFTNKAYKAWFNQPAEALLGRAVRDVVGDKAYQGIKGYIERALAGERLDFEAKMPYRENFVKHIRTSYVPDIQDGSVVGFYTMVTDITESVEARQVIEEGRQQAQAMAQELATTNLELSSINDQLRRTNVDLDNFIYTASHDLKAPITNIEGLLHALQQQLPPSSQEGDVSFILSMMHGAVDRFKTTIDHLTDVSKLQKEHDQPATTVDLAEVIEGVRLDLVPLMAQAQAHLEVDVDMCPTLSFSKKNLRSVVYNLLSNAFKYRHSDRPAQVRISCHTEAEYDVLKVQDNGLGLDLTRERQLFAMFQRYHTHVEGSGIGLYMVKKIIENAGGKIEAESEVGIGSAFSVYFRR
ncbi:PAS domain-containing protein [Hymenobacter sp. BT188]|uniref:PAS domain-containing protein n=1 Tax=Hymenobacter sp. BT188 TaxID=2763504 RepID=UPI0016511635|nr:PAS domain-containing protein [Hymenobacter sp. BT188]MBC6608575.1 PAS domain-containing protein [Hymenobacter sp. BT188]